MIKFVRHVSYKMRRLKTGIRNWMIERNVFFHRVACRSRSIMVLGNYFSCVILKFFDSRSDCLYSLICLRVEMPGLFGRFYFLLYIARTGTQCLWKSRRPLIAITISLPYNCNLILWRSLSNAFPVKRNKLSSFRFTGKAFYKDLHKIRLQL